MPGEGTGGFLALEGGAGPRTRGREWAAGVGAGVYLWREIQA